MGIFDFFKRAQSHEPPPTAEHGSDPQKLTYAEKERILARRVTTKDIAQFIDMPFYLDCPVHLMDEPYGHAFAYMNLNEKNISVAKAELEQINARISADSRLSFRIPNGLSIPVEDLVFVPSSEHGYTRLICTPYTFEGKISDIPLSLLFMTELHEKENSTHGTLHYGPDGQIAKANIYFWRGYKGHFFTYETLEQSLVLSKVELTTISRTCHSSKVVYQDQYWTTLELAREKEALDFKWLQTNLSGKCPKSVGGFRQMKHANSKNFQALVAEAAKHGRDIR